MSIDATPSIDAEAAAARARSHEVHLLDVRQPQEWFAGHVPGTVLIPLDELEERLGELPRDRPIIAVCRSGARSATATRFLRERGLDAVNLEGGTLAWRRAGLPLDPPDGHVA